MLPYDPSFETYFRAWCTEVSDVSKVDAAVDEWKNYFIAMNIQGYDQQCIEFHSIIRARMFVDGDMSLRAPVLKRELE